MDSTRRSTGFSGLIGNSGADALSLVKIGDGDLTLNATVGSFYSGSTTVNGGLLVVQPTVLANTSELNVGVGGNATLAFEPDGTGSLMTLASNTTVSGTLSAGSNADVGTVGSLDFFDGTNRKNLTFNNGSTWLVDIVQGGTPSFDAVIGVEDLNLNGTVNLALSFTDTFQLGNT